MILLFWLALLFALLNWFAVARHLIRLERVVKPATLALLTLWFWLAAPTLQQPFIVAFIAGLLFSLAGDIFLLFPDAHFLKGLIAFFLAHLAYLAAFNPRGPWLEARTCWLAAGIAILAYFLTRRIVAGLQASGRDSLVAPVILYAVVLSLTLWSTLATLFRPEWPPRGATLAAAGGALFFLSDALLAWNRFVQPLRHGRLANMISYHLAQGCMAFGLLAFAASVA